MAKIDYSQMSDDQLSEEISKKMEAERRGYIRCWPPIPDDYLHDKAATWDALCEMIPVNSRQVALYMGQSDDGEYGYWVGIESAWTWGETIARAVWLAWLPWWDSKKGAEE